MGIHMLHHKNLYEHVHLLFPNNNKYWHLSRRYLIKTIIKHTTWKDKTLPVVGLTINRRFWLL